MPLAIQVQGLFKKYLLGEHLSYHTFRDVLDTWGRSLFRKKNTFSEKDSRVLSALCDLSFEIKEGEVVGVIGKNGAGKSTLLKILSRITPPTQGRVLLRGKVAPLLEVGTGFHGELTGRENIFMNGAILGMSRAEILKKMDEIIAFAEVEKFLDTPVKRYSSGMYLRLAFAVAAHLEPDILLVDEVLAVGDAAFQKKCLGKIGSAAGQGRTILFVSHNMVALERLCHRVLWIAQGKLVEDGEPSSVIAHYLQEVATGNEKVWKEGESPGNDKVCLYRVAVVPLGEREDNFISIEAPLRIELDFENKQKERTLNFNVMFYHDDGVCAFNAISPANVFKKGRFRASFQVPAHLLNAGFYTLRVLIVEDTSVPILDTQDVVTFDVRDAKRDGYLWYGKWIGAVRPQFVWTSQSLENHAEKTF